MWSVRVAGVLVAGAAAWCVAFGVASAQGAAVIGSNLLGTPDNAYGASATFANTDLPPASRAPDGVNAPFGGVLTGWAIKTGGSSNFGNTLTLRVIAGNQSVATGIRRSAPLGAGITAYPERVPIQSGQMFGIRAGTIGAGVAISGIDTGVPGASYAVWNEPFPDGQNRPPDGTAPDVELLLQATIEPDADGDGFGDETQDGCLGVAGADAGCAAPSDPPGGAIPAAPETTIDSGPTGKVRKSKAKFSFGSSSAGATFECALDGRGYKPCSSPAKVKKLANGRHVFRVRAISVEGLLDRSPAEARFKVKVATK